MVTVKTEKNYIDDVIRYIQDRLYSFKAVTVVAVAALVTGTIMAKNTKSVATAAKASGAGNGTIGPATLGVFAIPGVYKIIFLTAGATGTASVSDPTGRYIGLLTVGTAFASDHINLTLSSGGTVWALADVVTVTVSGDDKYYPAAYAAVDGTGEPCGILTVDVAITTGIAVNMLVREGIIISNSLAWPASYDSNAKKATAFASLEKVGIYPESSTA